MKRTYLLVVLIVIGLVTSAFAAGTASMSDQSAPQRGTDSSLSDQSSAQRGTSSMPSTGMKSAAKSDFSAQLSGTSEVPSVTTDASGQATFRLSEDGKSLNYTITASNLDNPTAAHIHIGEAGESGPPVAPVAITGAAERGKPSGVIAEGTITEKDLIGPMKGKSLQDLVNEIQAGNAYVNIHSSSYPEGELRGQLK
ncbi:MAG: CHRD domain-containing protein [Nitrospirota bacterium]